MFRYRTIWISDIHLGTKEARTEELLDFLDAVDAEFLYIVGDLFDQRRMKRNWRTQLHHNEVIRKLLQKAHDGTEITYIPGNHDSLVRQYTPMTFHNIHLRREASHMTADGKRLRVLHGDEYDIEFEHGKVVQIIGSVVFVALTVFNRVQNQVRQRLGYSHWSALSYVKVRSGKAQEFFHNYKLTALQSTEETIYDGVICGHVHMPRLDQSNGAIYANTGDWVEHCTALVEHWNGELELLSWPQAAKEQFDYGEIAEPEPAMALAAN